MSIEAKKISVYLNMVRRFSWFANFKSSLSGIIEIAMIAANVIFHNNMPRQPIIIEACTNCILNLPCGYYDINNYHY